MRHLILLSLLALAACKAEPPAPVASEAPKAPVEKTVEAGKAAMQAPSGDSKALASINRAQAKVRAQPNDPNAWTVLGRTWIMAARADQSERLYDRAADAVDRALELEAGHRGALTVRALTLRSQHKFAEVQSIAAALVESEPRDSAAWGLLGDAELELGRYEAAERAYQAMIDEYPNIASYSRVAHLRWIFGDTPGALEMWDLAIEVGTKKDPEPLAWCLAEKGHVQWWAGALTEARELYDGALRIMPDHAGALLGRGRLLHAQGKHKDAIADLRASLAARPFEETWILLAAAERAAGNVAKADTIEARLRASGDFEDPRTISLYLSTKGLDAERAVKLARRDAAERGDLYTQDALAFALFRAGDLGGAAQWSDKALSTEPSDPRLLARAGLIAAAQGKKDRARALLTRALELNPAFDPWLAPEATRTLETL